MMSLATGSRDMAGTEARPRHSVFVSLDQGGTGRPRRGCEGPAVRHRAGVLGSDTIVAIDDAQDRMRVIVLPITHTAPQPPHEGIELLQPTKARLGLDGERSWIILSEGNDFIWPGPDLRPVAGQGSGSVAYGFLPPRLFQTVRDRFLARVRANRAGLTQRTQRRYWRDPGVGVVSRNGRGRDETEVVVVEVRGWLGLKMRTGRYSFGLVLELARHLIARTYNVHTNLRRDRDPRRQRQQTKSHEASRDGRSWLPHG
jgi:hypothetical protein